jgi:hypothetical protein
MNEQSIEQLQALIKSLAWNDGYDCWTRQGFEKLIWPDIESKARWIIFFDIDDMHGLNREHSYEGMNAIIKKSLQLRGSDFMAGQWFSGDEFIVCITDGDNERETSNPIEFAMRLSKIFNENGVPATFVIAPVTSSDLFTNVAPAHQLCQEAKAENNRGSISIVPGDPR